ncbi:MAG: M36 family metallopeptidase [Byssovorax sp.]
MPRRAVLRSSLAVNSLRISASAALSLLALTCLPVTGCAPASSEADGVSGDAPLLDGEMFASSWNVTTPRSLFGQVSTRVRPSEATARTLLARNAGMLGVRADLADLGVATSFETPLGEHYTFPQVHAGVPVYGAEIKVHYNREGSVIAVNNTYVPGLERVTVRPSISAKQAADHADAALDVSTRRRAENEEAASVDLVIFAAEGSPTLAYRVVREGDGPTWEVFVDAHTGAALSEPTDLNRYLNGTGKVFKINAVVATQNNSLVDASDAAAAVPSTAYLTVTLQGLTGNGLLDGTFAASSYNSKRASSATNTFSYDRSMGGFNETMGYYYIDFAERYIQSLGFTNVNNRQQVFATDRYKQDNSYYTPSTKKISFGTGGVDDAEDGEVILHEYGHSIQDNEVPGFGSSAQAGAMGEGFGDYWAASVGAQLSGGYQDTCVAEWDAVSYASGVPHCLRRLDSTKHYPQNVVGEVHADGEIWSAALWQIRGSIGATNADKVILQAHFLLTAGASFNDGANAIATAAANLGFTATEITGIRTILQSRGFTLNP